jgi:hypothetical protein
MIFYWIGSTVSIQLDALATGKVWCMIMLNKKALETLWLASMVLPSEETWLNGSNRSCLTLTYMESGQEHAIKFRNRIGEENSNVPLSAQGLVD